MASYPGSIYDPRTKSNRPGIEYDPEEANVLFAEDVSNLDAEVVALEQNLQDKRDRLVHIVAVSQDDIVPTGDGVFNFIVPAGLNGYDIVAAHAGFIVPETGGDSQIDIYNTGLSHSIFNPAHKIVIDQNEYNSYTSADQPVIDTDYDALATGDVLRIDVGTEPSDAQGLQIFLTVRKPIA
jgi:hypothetical protein